jgi:hypothetical protein
MITNLIFSFKEISVGDLKYSKLLLRVFIIKNIKIEKITKDKVRNKIYYY